MKHTIIEFKSLDSTSTYIKNNYASVDDGSVVTSITQTSGRGRLGRHWIDDGKSLLFSFLLKGKKYSSLLDSISLLSGAAMELTLLELGLSPLIKWPNDIYINDKKVCGILAEGISSSSLECIVVGIGLNLNNSSFEEGLNATSIYLETKKEFDKKAILFSFLSNLDKLLESEEKNPYSFSKIIAAHDYLKDKDIYLNYYGENKFLHCLGINSTGALLGKDEEGKLITVTSGEANVVTNLTRAI